jgi:YbgC/YbaW family acyl-CoA thioester hydrolase
MATGFAGTAGGKMTALLTYRRRVEFADTDMGGILHFASFFRYMEEAEHAAWREHGMSVVQELDGKTLSWPRVSASCDFISPARYGDVLEIGVRLARVGGKSLTWEFDIRRGDTDIARGRIVCVACEFEVHKSPIKSVAVPRELIERLTDGGVSG